MLKQLARCVRVLCLGVRWGSLEGKKGRILELPDVGRIHSLDLWPFNLSHGHSLGKSSTFSLWYEPPSSPVILVL